MQHCFDVASTSGTDILSMLCDVENPTSDFVSFSTSDQRYFNVDPQRGLLAGIGYYKDELPVATSSSSHVVGLSKTRWVERYKAYENYYLLLSLLLQRLAPFVIHICTKKN